MQLNDDHNNPMFVDNNMSSAEDDIDSVKKYLDRLELFNSKYIYIYIYIYILEVLRDHYKYHGVFGY